MLVSQVVIQDNVSNVFLNWVTILKCIRKLQIYVEPHETTFALVVLYFVLGCTAQPIRQTIIFVNFFQSKYNKRFSINTTKRF